MARARRYFTISWDLGKRNDFSAVSIVERTGKGDEAQYLLRHLQRVARGTTYDEVEEHIITLYDRVAVLGEVELVCDRGGIGDAIIDSLRAKGYAVVGFVATGGERVTEVTTRGKQEVHVPKAKLFINLSAAVETAGQFLISKGLAFGAIFRGELARLTYRRTPSGGVVFGNEAGAHDDLISSVSMGYWRAKKQVKRAEPNFRWL